MGNFSRDFLTDKCIEILLSGLRSSNACNALKFFFRRILRSEAVVYNSYFFRTAVLWKLFDIRFSYNVVISHALPTQDGVENLDKVY